MEKAALEAADHVPAVATFNNSKYIFIPEEVLDKNDFGCWEHRNLSGQTKIAKYLAPRIAQLMNW